MESKVGADDEVTSTAKNSTAVKKLIANTTQFAKLRYEGYKRLSEGKKFEIGLFFKIRKTSSENGHVFFLCVLLNI